MSYEYLKPLFEGGPLSFEQLTEKLDAADGVKLANLKDGGYVGKDKFDALEGIGRRHHRLLRAAAVPCAHG